MGRALVMRPKLLVLDEPTEGIQPSIIKDIGRAITYLKEKAGLAIVLVEQYLDLVRELLRIAWQSWIVAKSSSQGPLPASMTPPSTPPSYGLKQAWTRVCRICSARKAREISAFVSSPAARGSAGCASPA